MTDTKQPAILLCGHEEQPVRPGPSQSLEQVANYLYEIDGDCSPELAQAIGMLRQLINEEFVGKDKTISSQYIYDILKGAL